MECLTQMSNNIGDDASFLVNDSTLEVYQIHRRVIAKSGDKNHLFAQ